MSVYLAYSGQSGGLTKICVLNAGQALNLICSKIQEDNGQRQYSCCSASGKCSLKQSSRVSGPLIPWC